MAKKVQKSLLKKLLVIGGVLVALQVVFIFVFSDREKLTPMEAINKAVEKIPDVTPARRELARVQLALADFMQQNKGVPPDSLARLVPKYFNSMPIDPSTGKPFAYRVEGNRFFVGDDTVTAGTTSSSTGRAGTSSTPGAGQTPSVALSEAEKASILEALSDDPSKVPTPYSSVGKRDPFRPIDLSPRDDGTDEKTPLERVTISSLVFSAYIASGDQPKAIVEDANGRGYTIEKGTRIGTDQGVVTEILPDKIVIVETQSDFTGETKSKTVELFKGVRSVASGTRRR